MTPFECDLKVRFADVDHAKVVYYPHFFHYFHVAFEELYEHVLGQSYPEVIDGMGIGYPAVHSEADYHAPARFGDVLRIRVTCTHLGAKSVTLRYRARRRRDDVECAVGHVTVCCVDMTTFRSRRVPDEHRALFEQLREAAPEA